MEVILNIVYYIIPFIVLLGILVFVHEFGHFIVARFLGVGVSAFSLGFGKELWSRTDKHGTTWKICAVPLGGYCQFLGDADASSSTESDLSALSEEEKAHSFPLQKTWKKLAIVIAGPLFNYLFAILLFIGIFYFCGKIVYPAVVADVVPGGAAEAAGIMSGDRILSINGKPTPDFQSIKNEVYLSAEPEISIEISRPLTFNLRTTEINAPSCSGNPEGAKEKLLGIVSTNIFRDPATCEEHPLPPVIGSIIPGSAAEAADIHSGDKLVSINDVRINEFADLKKYVSEHSDEPMELKVQRVMLLHAVLKDMQYGDDKTAKPMLGVISGAGSIVKDSEMGFAGAVKSGFVEAWDLTAATLRAVGQMITGQRSGKEVGGIIRIAELSGDISKSGGFISFIYFMALLSVNLGLINILPVPVLDGGHVVIFLCELITGRELKPEIKDYIFKFGLLIILAIMILATWNDVAHLISRWFD